MEVSSAVVDCAMFISVNLALGIKANDQVSHYCYCCCFSILDDVSKCVF